MATRRTRNPNSGETVEAKAVDIETSEDRSGFDISPLILREIALDSGVLRRNAPFVVKPYVSESHECYRAEVEELGLSISAYTRQELVEAIQDMIAVLWQEYAMEDDENLTESAAALKRRLLEDFRIVDNAT